MERRWGERDKGGEEKHIGENGKRRLREEKRGGCRKERHIAQNGKRREERRKSVQKHQTLLSLF